MDLKFFGANCLRISNKKINITVDDNLAELGAKSVIRDGDVVISTHGADGVLQKKPRLLINQPGEYEVSDILITGVPARSHMDEDGQRSSTIFKVEVDDIKLAIVGHIYPKLTETQLETLGIIDVLIIPVGGNGYTLDGEGAHKLIQAIDPKVIIPTHYDDKSLKFEVPQAKLADALKAMGMEPTDTVDKLKIKHSDLDGENTKLFVLEKS